MLEEISHRRPPSMDSMDSAIKGARVQAESDLARYLIARLENLSQNHEKA